MCLSDQSGKRFLYIIPGVNNLLTINDLDLNCISQATILHVSSFADDRQFKTVLELMAKLDLTTTRLSFTPGALFASKGIRELSPILNKTCVLFINHNEIRQLTNKDITSGAEACLREGCRIVVVTLGKGMSLEQTKEVSQRPVIATCYIRDTENEYIIRPTTQNRALQADTTGAGDTFATGFLYGLFKEALNDCGYLGQIVAQCSITKLGSREELPTFTELSQRYYEFYDREL